jgi:hypothetical protein
MGFRTVVALNNDTFWNSNKNLADDISEAVHRHGRDRYPGSKGIHILEQVHADQVSLLKIGFYGNVCERKAVTYWEDKNQDLNLLKEFANSMGYRLVKK